MVLADGGGGQHVLQHNSSDNYQTIISIIIIRLVDALLGVGRKILGTKRERDCGSSKYK